jgi:nucleotide-binding universal stress UspA family protein
MKNILVLVDFTDTAKKALDQALALAKRMETRISICYVSKASYSETEEELQQDLNPYLDSALSSGVEAELCILIGDLFDEVSKLVLETRPSLVVVGTHGKKGLRQNLFGSAILKLVKQISAPSLVVNDNLELIKGGFENVMLAVAPHANYLLKVEQTIPLLSKEGKVVIFNIIKPGVGISEEIKMNIRKTQDLLEKNGKKWEYLELDADRYSVGYAQQTLDTSAAKGMDLISIMANVSDENQHFGNLDKENVLLNKQGIPVLCAN